MGEGHRVRTWPPLDISVVSRTGQIINVIYSYSQFGFIKGIIEVRNIMTALGNKFDNNSTGDANDAAKLERELDILREITTDANQHIGLAMSAGLVLLQEQNLSVSGLFRQFNEPLPPGFN